MHAWSTSLFKYITVAAFHIYLSIVKMPLKGHQKVMEITFMIMENHGKIMEMCFLISVGTLIWATTQDFGTYSIYEG